MFHRPAPFGVVVLAVAVVAGCGRAGRPPQVEPPPAEAERTADEAQPVAPTEEELRASGPPSAAPKGLAGDTPRRLSPPRIDAEAAGRLAIGQYDTDKDGFIAGAELDKAPSLKASMRNLDTNVDKKVSEEEITARIQKWEDDRVGKMSLMVRVTRGGQPLVGATVKFVPGKFLGEEVQIAEGVTDEQGCADLTVPPDPNEPNIRGVHCGLFRVEISKKAGGKETIPARYNTQTIFGQEVSVDAANIQEGIVFELESLRENAAGPDNGGKTP